MAETLHNHFLGETYPPQDHMLRDLGIDVVTDGMDAATVQAPVVPEICSNKGVLYVGVLATLVDVLGGVLAIPAVRPDWISTSNLSIHSTQAVLSGRICADGHVLRSGRTAIVIGVQIQVENSDGPQKRVPVGYAMITYSRLPGNKTNLHMNTHSHSHDLVRYSLKGAGLDMPFVHKAGIHIQDRARGKLVLKMTDYVRNSLGSLQGGMTAFLADLAGQSLAGTQAGTPGQTRDLIVHYMSPGMTGPFQTTAEVLRMDRHSALTRIRVLDRGMDDRLMAVVMNSVDISDG
jgi:uncharacterized protein (TIGR00369 family)